MIKSYIKYDEKYLYGYNSSKKTDNNDFIK